MGKRIVAIMGSMDNDIDMVSYVKNLMREKDLSLTDVAKMSGVTKQAIYDSLTRPNTNYYAIKRILQALRPDLLGELFKLSRIQETFLLAFFCGTRVELQSAVIIADGDEIF